MSFTSQTLELKISDKPIQVEKFLEKIGDKWCSSVMGYDYKTHDPNKQVPIFMPAQSWTPNMIDLTGIGYHSQKFGGNAIFIIPVNTYYIESDCTDMIVSERIEFVKFK